MRHCAMCFASLSILMLAGCSGNPSMKASSDLDIAASAVPPQLVEQAIHAPVLRKLEDHSMAYYMFLPRGRAPGKRWPVAVIVTGSNSNFEVMANGYHDIRHDLPFIIVVPTTVSSGSQITRQRYPHFDDKLLAELAAADMRTKLEFDHAGIDAVIADVAWRFSGERRYYLSGFSMGGNINWDMIFRYPQKLHAAAPSCAVFAAEIGAGRSSHDQALPVLAFQGRNDGMLDHLNTDWQKASALAEKRGYSRVSRIVSPRGHSWHYEEILAFFYGHYVGRSGAAR